MDPVTVSIEEGRADLVLHRPEVLNAMDWSVFDGLGEALDRLEAADDVRVVVVSGEGRSFSTGIDISALGEIQGGMEATIKRAQAGFRKLAKLPLPTIAMMRGHAYGAGLQLALACDLRVAADGTKMGLLESTYGLVPDLIGSTRLPQLVGSGRAKRMIWLAEKLDATEAERIGLVEWVVPADELETSVDDLAARLVDGPRTAIRESKRLVDAAHALDVDAGMDAEMRAQIACFTADDFAAALSAGLERTRSRK
jgi:enoyl-CoA hydratase